ncbi:hypothetical protein GCM10009535_39080 [Streptomyces thermocarboxydovorans]|uniref:Uncharacterized protein n=1 Tax=Streptomyces thermocarboxydovorans TaxID=59298 RepID=A0ABN1HK52_9ACTN
MVRDVPRRYAGSGSVEGESGGTLVSTREGARRRTPVALTLPCAPTPGTEILTGGIPVGNQNEDSAKGTMREERNSTNRGEEGGSNASLEGLAG